LGGFYRAFFVLFLKTELAWSQNFILIFCALFSLAFLPVSLWVIRRIGEQQSFKNIFQGGMVAGLLTIILGIAAPLLNFFSVLLINIGRAVGALMADSGRSGLVNRELKKYPEEAGAIDTIFAPLGTALGSLISGLTIAFLGYNLLFIVGGVFVLLTVVLGRRLPKR